MKKILIAILFPMALNAQMVNPFNSSLNSTKALVETFVKICVNKAIENGAPVSRRQMVTYCECAADAFQVGLDVTEKKVIETCQNFASTEK